MPNHISLSDSVLNRMRCLVSSWILLRELIFRYVVVLATGFWPAVRPSPAWPARPWRPLLPIRVPRLPLVYFFHLISPAQQPLSLSLRSLSLPVVVP
jgi:hypothetical protein